MKLTNARVFVTGAIVEVYYYRERDLSYAFRSPKKNSCGSGGVASEENKQRCRLSSESRSKSNLKRLINTNAHVSNGQFNPVFGTFTFKENIKDLEIANVLFSKFIKRLNYFVRDGEKKSFLKYVVVPEFQKRGAVHYHAIFFNLKFIQIEILSKIWDQGFIFFKKIDHLNNVGSYISKYLCKDVGENRLKKHKRYFASRNLKRPIEIKDKEICLEISKLLPKASLMYKKDLESEYHGKIVYAQFNLNEDPERLNAINETIEAIRNNRIWDSLK